MRLSLFLNVLLVMAVAVAAVAAVAAVPAVAAECKTMIYTDQNGAVVPLEKPIVGLMLAGTPITGPVSVPGAVKREVGATTQCPKELVQKIQDLFDDSCMSEANRAKTRVENKVDAATINQRCADMAEALHPAVRQ